jgi:hypothetical protein
MRQTETGLTVHDQARATPGFTLFVPISYQTVFLLDMAGKIVHQWALKAPCRNLAYLHTNGNLLVTELSEGGPNLKAGRGGAMREYDWDGNLLWEYIDPAQHHDFQRLPNGNNLYLAWERMSDEAQKRVRGGLAGTEHKDGGIYSDCLKEVTPAGETVWAWHFQDMEIEKYPMQPLCLRDEFAHANACYPLENGDVMVSFRRLSMIAIVDRKTRRFKWEHSDITWGQQHDCQMLDNGNILFFANGLGGPGLPYSRVIELDPETKETVWAYEGKPVQTFFSPHISGAQRLRSGNTLICEGGWGRIFEVTPAGDIVWEYINPFTYEDDDSGPLNWVFRAYRYAEDSPQIQRRVRMK